jgi:hypothetical protein
MAQGKHTSTLEIEGPRSLRRSRDEGRALVEQWRESGLRPAEFCRTRGIAEHRLHYWKRRLQGDGEGERAVSESFFAVIAADQETATVEAGWESVAEICVSGSVRVRVSLSGGAEAFTHALRAVLQVVGS